MTSDLLSFASLAPAYPELVLAIGIVVLLLAGVTFSRERSAGIAILSILLLVVVIGVAIWQPAEGVLFNGGFIADAFSRYMKFLVLGGSAFALVLSTSTAKPMGLDKFEYSILVLLATLGMMVMVSANDLMSPLCRPRAAIAGALCRRRAQAQRSEGHRSGPQIFRPRRAQLRHAALWRVAGLWLHGLTQLDQIVGAVGGERSIGLVFGMVFLLAASPSRSRPCRSICGRPTSMRARPPRSPPSSPRPRRSQPWR